jgi:NAD(P)-dependent dehydrogenase (short-subunit alcohol dehydrogenase family)
VEGKSQRQSFLEKFRVDGKVALITGGSRGIGKCIASALAEAGADIILTARKLPDLEATAQEISKIGRKVLPVQANVRHLPEIETLVKKSVDEFGRIDILINNAGTNPRFGSIFQMDEAVWDIVMGLNLKSYFFLSQAVAKISASMAAALLSTPPQKAASGRRWGWGLTPSARLGSSCSPRCWRRSSGYTISG